MSAEFITLDTSSKVIHIRDRAYEDSIDNYRTLSAAGVLKQGPIYRYYDFPSIHRSGPMMHQKVTCDFMTKYDRGFVFNSIGTGKTLIMDWYYDFMRQEKKVNKCLIIAPLSTLRSVHEVELKWSLPRLSYEIIYGSRDARLKKLSKDVDIYIINFDGFLAKWGYDNEQKCWVVRNSTILKALEEREDIDCILIDEVAVLRNKSTNAWRSINYLFGPHTDKVVWGFTGSPVPNDPIDAYGQALLINPEAIPKRVDMRSHKQVPISYTQFKHTVMSKDPYSEFKWNRKKGWQSKCEQVLQPSIRFTRDDVEPDLPVTTTVTRDIPLTKPQKDAYIRMAKEFSIELNASTITAVHEGARLLKLAQICSGAIYGNDDEVHTIDCEPRIKELVAIKKQIDSHLLVAIPFVGIAEHLRNVLSKWYNVEYIAGKHTSEKKRAEYIARFTKRDLDILLATPGSIPHGVNLQHKCHTTVWWGPINRYDIYEQFNGRNDRKGQTKKVLIFHFQGAQIESMMYNRLKHKGKMQGILLKLLKEKNYGL